MPNEYFDVIIPIVVDWILDLKYDMLYAFSLIFMWISYGYFTG